MRRCRARAAFLLVASFASLTGFSETAVWAQAESKSYEHLKILGAAGRWTGKGTYRSNQFTCEMERKWSDDKGVLLFTQRYYDAPRTNDEPGAINTGMFGWDPAKRKIKCCWFITDGRSATSFYTAEKNRLIGKRYLSEADGNETVRNVTFDLHADGSISYKSVDPKTNDVILHIEWTPVRPD